MKASPDRNRCNFSVTFGGAERLAARALRLSPTRHPVQEAEAQALRKRCAA